MEKGPIVSDTPSRKTQLFLEVFEELPRQGPGRADYTARALSLCEELGPKARILDLGCGVGRQTLDLAKLTKGLIVAVDKHEANIEKLRAVLSEQGLSQRITAIAADMLDLEQEPESFDLIWSEGALYNIGMDKALPLCHKLLQANGYLAFTDAVWQKEDPPREVRKCFEDDYPTMGWAEDILAKLQAQGFSSIDHFTLPEHAWWDDFYTPMVLRIDELRRHYQGDEEALSILEEIAQEPKIYQRYSDYYAYEFFVARRVD